MSYNLLVTKLFIPPISANLVPRPRLVQKLDEAWQLGRKLILVSAPAGYGKTTVLVQWIRQYDLRAAWLSLDENDNDPARFLAYLIAALKQVDERIGVATQALLQSPQPPPGEVVLTTLINDITGVANPFLLVLDDYHVIHNPLIHEKIAFLLGHQPPQMHLVILTREDPLLPVSRLRARGQVLETRQDDLRFTAGEMADFLRRNVGLELSPDDIAALELRTEGWIAGVQLAALSMQGRANLKEFIQAFTGSSRYVLDFLIEEVLERQTAEVQDFLVKTSILDRLSGPLCDSVAERTSSQALLEILEQANLFIVPLDQSRQWYRYHRLFSELLRHRLRTLGHPLEVSLHQRASQWYEAKGYPSEAVHHALEARDWDRSAALIEQASGALLKRGELVTLIGWCEKLPDGVVASQPSLGLSYAWALSLLGQFDKAEGILSKIEEIATSIPPLMGQVASAQAYVARGKGDNARAIEKSRQALALLPASDAQGRGLLALNLGLVYWHEGQLREAAQILNEVVGAARQAGNQYALFTAQIFLARTLASQGELRRAEERYQQIIRDGGQVPILALAHYDLCGIYYEWNDLAKAGDHLEKGLELCTRSSNVEFQNSGHILKAFLRMAHGNPRQALAEVEVSHTLARHFNPATQARSAACHAQIALAMGDVDTAAHWVTQMAEDVGVHPSDVGAHPLDVDAHPLDVDAHPFYRFIGLIRPRLLIAQGKKAAARELLQESSTRAAQAGWGYAMVAIRILQVLAAEEQEAALEVLEEALKSAQAEGYLRAFVDSGRSLVPLLQESARRGVLPEYIGQILRALGEGRKQTVVSTLPLVEPLSEREIEVLRLVIAGLSNREIAEKLVISPGTAKTHIHHICGKLGVRNRTEAALQAKELNLV